MRTASPRNGATRATGCIGAANSASEAASNAPDALLARLIGLQILVCARVEGGQPACAAGVRVEASPAGDDERHPGDLRRMPAKHALAAGMWLLGARQMSP